jgi:HlyD family secretion protein
LLNLARQIWRLLDTTERRECLLVLLISVTAACLTLVGVAGITPFFAVLANPAVVDHSATLAWLQKAVASDTPQRFLVLLGIGFVAILSLANLANFLAILSIGRFSQHVGARMHSLLFDEYLHRSLRFHAGSNSAALAARVVHDVNRTVGVIYSGLTLCASAVSAALITAAVVIVDPLVALAATTLLSVSYAVIYSLVRQRLVRNGIITTNHWKSRAQLIAESFAAIKDVILHRAHPTMASQMARHSAAIAAAQASTPAIAASPKYVLESVTAAGLVAAALWTHGAAGADRWLTHLAFLGFAAYRLLPAVQQLFAALARIHAERAGFDAIVDDLRRARQRTAREPSATSSAEWRGRPRQEVRLRGVSYRYSTDGAAGVTDVSLEIAAGTLVAFVGRNGAGKSTLAELILGLLKPDAGRIEIDGVALEPGNRDAWLDTIAYIPQRVTLLDGTIAHNIAFGVAADDLDLERILEAARAAQLGPMIDGLPEGVETVIGENGARLSGGQRQRIGIARALHRRASLLVVDEGTNALDALTEAEIMTLLGTLRGTCTVIVIAHHPSSLTGCDVLFELDGGRLVKRTALAERASGPQPWQVARR